MDAKLIIHGKLIGLNEYTKANRANKYAGAQQKSNMEQLIATEILIQKIPKFDGKVRLDFAWYEPNKKRDLDNICFAKKFILDALVKCGVLKTDDWRGVGGFTDTFFVSKDNPRIEVRIEDARAD